MKKRKKSLNSFVLGQSDSKSPSTYVKHKRHISGIGEEIYSMRMVNKSEWLDSKKKTNSTSKKKKGRFSTNSRLKKLFQSNISPQKKIDSASVKRKLMFLKKGRGAKNNTERDNSQHLKDKIQSYSRIEARKSKLRQKNLEHQNDSEKEDQNERNLENNNQELMINRLKLENDKLTIENKSFKEMQKLLMKRLKQQDEYMEHCLLIKEQEIVCLENLTKKLKRESKLLEIKNIKLEDDITMLIKHIEKTDMNTKLYKVENAELRQHKNREDVISIDYSLEKNQQNSKNQNRSKSASKSSLGIFDNLGMVVIQEEDESEEIDSNSKRESREKMKKSHSSIFQRGHRGHRESKEFLTKGEALVKLDVGKIEDDGKMKKRAKGSEVEIREIRSSDVNSGMMNLGLDEEVIDVLAKFKEIPIEEFLEKDEDRSHLEQN